VPTVTRSRDGVSIHYEIHGTGDSTAVLVHGWGFDRRIWDAAIPRLARTRRVAALDLAGHGHSGRERRRPTVASFAEDVCAVLQAVGAPRVVLVGHSMGGPVVVEAARRMSDRVAGVVLVDTLHDVEATIPPEEHSPTIFAALEADFAGAVGRWFRETMFTPTTEPALIETVVARAQAMDPEIGLAAIQSTLSYDARDALRALDMAVRAINADHFPTNAAAMRRYVRDFDYTVLGGTGHYPMLEQPERFAQVLERSVNEIADREPLGGRGA
jgi:pimeloyl-ACP methyl ester carboxylesterase